MWWLKHPEFILCNFCQKREAEACVKGHFECWLGEAFDGDFICLECAAKIGLPKERMIIKVRAIDATPISPLLQ